MKMNDITLNVLSILHLGTQFDVLENLFELAKIKSN